MALSLQTPGNGQIFHMTAFSGSGGYTWVGVVERIEKTKALPFHTVSFISVHQHLLPSQGYLGYRGSTDQVAMVFPQRQNSGLGAMKRRARQQKVETVAAFSQVCCTYVTGSQ